MNPSRKDLRFPKTILAPIRYLVEKHDPGVSFDEVLHALRVSREQFDAATFTIDGDAFLALHRWLKQRTQGRIGLREWFSCYSATSAGFVGLAAFSAFTARDALAVVVRYMPLVMPAIRAELVEGPETSRLELDMVADLEEMNRVLLEVTIGSISRISRDAMGEDIPWVVHFRHDCGVDSSGKSRLAEYREAFGCEVVFNSSFNGFSSRSKYLDWNTSRANTATYNLASSLLDSEIRSRVASQSFASLVGSELMQLANDGHFPSLEAFADRMHLSPRTLIRKLAGEGTSYKQLTNEAWFRLARELLANSKNSIDQVARKTGFTSSNSFSRAFKAMAGETPMQWKKTRRDGRA